MNIELALLKKNLICLLDLVDQNKHIEQLWSWMRQHYSANQALNDYNDIVDKLCVAWNQFAESGQRVSKMC